MRIAFLTTHPIQYQAPLFRELAGLHDLEVLFAANLPPGEQADGGFGVRFEWDIPLLDGYPHRFLRNVAIEPGLHRFRGLDSPEVKQIVSSRSFDVIIVHGWNYKCAWQAIFAAWKHKVPVLVRSDSHLHTRRSRSRSAAKWPFYRYFIPRLNGCLPVGIWSEAYFRHYGAQPAKIFKVPHCVDTDRFRINSMALCRKDLREKWELPVSSVTFLFAGKLVAKKRPLDFLSAVARCRESGREISGLVVGDGPLRQECEAFVRQHRLPVRFAGFLNQTEIVEAYVVADALVLPSEGSETWGLVVNEAMACGLPAFVSDHVGCGPDLIENGRTGAIFPLGDTEALAALLMRYDNAARLAAMGRVAQQRSESFSASSSARALTQAVSSVVREHRDRHI